MHRAATPPPVSQPRDSWSSLTTARITLSLTGLVPSPIPQVRCPTIPRSNILTPRQETQPISVIRCKMVESDVVQSAPISDHRSPLFHCLYTHLIQHMVVLSKMSLISHCIRLLEQCARKLCVELENKEGVTFGVDCDVRTHNPRTTLRSMSASFPTCLRLFSTSSCLTCGIRPLPLREVRISCEVSVSALPRMVTQSRSVDFRRVFIVHSRR